MEEIGPWLTGSSGRCSMGGIGFGPTGSSGRWSMGEIGFCETLQNLNLWRLAPRLMSGATTCWLCMPQLTAILITWNR